MVDLPSNFIYVFPLIYAIVVGVIELFFVHADEHGLGWIGHGLHAIPWCIVFSYASFNIPFLIRILEEGAGFALPSIVGLAVIPLFLAGVTAFKVKAAAALAKGGTVGEKLIHAIIIGVLIAIGPYILLGLQFVTFLPSWLFL